MSSEFHIHFRGSCTFVRSNDRNTLWVLLRAPVEREGVPRHLSAIKFRAQDLAPSTGQMEPQVSGLVLLKGHDFAVTSAVGPALQGSLAQVSPVEEACRARGLAPGGGTVRPAVLAKSADARRHLAARFTFTAGELVTRELQNNTKHISWRFRPFRGPEKDNDLIRRVAGEVVLKLHTTSNTLTLAATRLWSQTPIASVTLIARDAQPVVIEVFNEEAERILDPTPIGEPPKLKWARRRDRIFETAYDLAVNPPTETRRPMPVAEETHPLPRQGSLGDVIVDGSPPCNPKLMHQGTGAATVAARRLVGESRKKAWIPIAGEEGARAFLTSFGYLDPEEADAAEGFGDALKEYQRYFGLHQSRVLDPETLEEMNTPRCAHPDRHVHWKKNVVERECPWPPEKVVLHYEFGRETDDVKVQGQALAQVTDAFGLWNEVLEGRLEMKAVTRAARADIRVEWIERQDTDLGLAGPALAHADFPGECAVLRAAVKPLHFDDGEHDWGVGSIVDGHDIFTVALHEIGHLLGLRHDEDSQSIMHPNSPPGMLKLPTLDDERRVRRLYGLPLPPR